jgi:hypothetical protein
MMKCLSQTCPFRDLCTRNLDRSISGARRSRMHILTEEEMIPPPEDEANCPWFSPRPYDG